MSDISFPTAFPKPTVNFNFEMDGGVIRSQMASGRARQRQQSTAELRLVQVTFDLDDIQLYLFQSFYKVTLLGGAEYFNIDLPLGGGIQSYEARIVADRAYKSQNNSILNWKLSLVLEVEEMELFDDEELELALLLYPDVDLFIDSADDFHTLVHQTLNTQLA